MTYPSPQSTIGMNTAQRAEAYLNYLKASKMAEKIPHIIERQQRKVEILKRIQGR